MNFKKCQNCDMENPETEVYCLECGTKLDPEKPLPRPGAPSAAPPLPAVPPVAASGPSTRPAPAEPQAQSGPPEPESVSKALPGSSRTEPPAGRRIPGPVTPVSPAPPPKHPVESKVHKKTGRRLPALPSSAYRVIVSAMAVIIVGAVVRLFIFPPGRSAAVAPPPDKTGIVVLPFEGLGAAEGRGYFGEGLAEALIEGLNHLPGLRLTGITSSALLKAKYADSVQAGRAVGSDYVLAGTFESDGRRLLVTAQLLKTADSSKVWENQFERGPEAVFGVLQEIARGLVQALKIPLSDDGVNALFGTRTVDPEACDLYFRGRSLKALGGKDNLEKAVEIFEQAAAKDPGWAAIPAAAGKAYVDLGSASLWSPDRAFPAARKAILQALELEPGLGEARLALAILKWRSEWDWAGAGQELEEALVANHGQPEIRRSYALYLSSLGRHEEAQSEIKRARDLDPLSPRVNADLGMVLYYARLYDLAGVELTRARDAAPADFEPLHGLGLLYIQNGDFEGSLRMFQQAAALGGDPREMSLRIGVVLARLGRRQDVGRILNDALETSRQSYVSFASLATVYAALMEPDQAHACLEKAFAEKDASLVFLKVAPLFDLVRGRPWFAGLLKEIGL
jgi:adenylate cyclase